jgi:hypothetical protein
MGRQWDPIQSIPRPEVSSCCSLSNGDSKQPRKHHCPVKDLEYAGVSVRTIVHHLAAWWTWTPTARHYYFCGDPECDVAYYGDDNSVVLKSQLQIRIGVKERGKNDLLCYCFGISRADFERDPDTKNFVTSQTKAGMRSCETSNPSGRCCLKDIPESLE